MLHMRRDPVECHYAMGGLDASYKATTKVGYYI